MPTFKTPFYGITFLYRAPGGPTGGGRECPFWGGSKPYLAEPRKGPKIDAFLRPFLGPFDPVWAPLCQWGLGPPLAGLRGGPHWGGVPPLAGGGPHWEGPPGGSVQGSVHYWRLDSQVYTPQSTRFGNGLLKNTPMPANGPQIPAKWPRILIWMVIWVNLHQICSNCAIFAQSYCNFKFLKHFLSFKVNFFNFLMSNRCFWWKNDQLDTFCIVLATFIFLSQFTQNEHFGGVFVCFDQNGRKN